MRRFNINIITPIVLVFASLGVSFAQPVFTLQNKKDACNGLQNGSVDILVTSATGSVSAFIFNAGHAPNPIGPVSLTVGVPTSITGLVGTITGNAAFVVVTDIVGSNNSSKTIFLFSDVSVTPPAPTITDVTTCSPFNGAIDITPSGGSGTYTFAWTGPSGFTETTEDLISPHVPAIGPGNYSVTVSDANTVCTSTLSPITINIASPSITLGSIPGVCSGTASSALSYSATTGGVNQYKIDWVSGPPNVGLTALPPTPIPIAGIPTVVTTTTFNGTLTGLNTVTGCFTAGNPISVTVTANVTPSVSIAASPGSTICTGASVTFTATPTNGGVPVYQWKKNGVPVGAGGPTYTDGGLVTGDQITVDMTSNLACVTTPTATSNIITMTVNPPATASVLSGTAGICSGSSTNLKVTITGGTSQFTVVYHDGLANIDIPVNNYVSGTNIPVSPAATTTYTLVSVTDANSCPSSGLSGTAIVTVGTPATASVLSGTATICSGTSTNLVVNVTGGTGPFTVVYHDGVANIDIPVNNYVNGSNIPVSPAVTTTYTLVSVTDANNCPSAGLSGTAVVTVNPSATSSVLSGTTAICSGNSTNLVVTITGGISPFTVVYHDNVANIDIPVNNYVSGTTIPVSPAATTTYTLVSVTGANGCPSVGLSGTAVVTVNTPATASVLSGTTTICNGSSTNLVVNITGGTSPFTVVYHDNVANIDIPVNNYVSGTNIPVSPAVTTTYTLVSVTDASSCPGSGLSGTAVVTIGTPATASVLSGTATICSGASTNLKVTVTGGTGPFTVVYHDGVANIDIPVNNYVNGSNIPVNPATTTTYTLISVTDANNCPSAGLSGSAVVTVNNPATASVISGTATICSGTNTNLVVNVTGGTSPYTVVYHDGAGNIDIPVNNYVSGSNIPISPAATTTYTLVSVTDANNCPSGGLSGSAVVTVNPSATSSVLSGTATTCNGSSTNLVVTITGGVSPFNVVYHDGTNNVDIPVPGYVSGTNISVSPAVTTTYTLVSVTGANGCASTGLSGTAVVTVGTPATASVLSGTATICSGTSTNLKVTVTGGTSPFTVVYSDGFVSSTVNNYVSGANIPVSPVVSTTYTLVSVTDANGCPSAAPTGTAAVTVKPSATSSVLSGTAAICSGSSTNLVVTIVGGVAPFTVVYSDGVGNIPVAGYVSGTSIPVSPAATTTYSLVSVTGANGCASNGLSAATAVVTVGTPATASVLSGTATICSGASTNLKVTVTGGTGPFTVVYNPGNISVPNYVNGTNISVSPAATTTYTLVSVTDANNCPSGGPSGTAVVTVNSIPTTSAITGLTPVCKNAAGVSYSVVNTPGSSYAWTITNGAQASGGVTNSITVNWTIAGAGNVRVVETNSNNCPGAPVNLPVTVNALPTASFSSGNTAICTGSSTSLQVSFTGVAPWTFSYSDGVTTSSNIVAAASPFSISVNPASTTTYALISVSDANCTGTITGSPVIVTVDAPPDVTLGVSAAVSPLCNGGSTTIDVVNSENGVSYQLRNGVTAVGSAIAGNGATIHLPTGALASTTTFNVLATRGACTPLQLNNTATVAVSGSINAGLTVTPQTATLCSGTGTNIRVAASEIGVNYQLRDNSNNANIGGIVAGTGVTLDLPTGTLNATTTFNILASNGTCSVQLTNLATVNVGINPNPGLAVSALINPLCSGGSTSVTVTGSEVGVSYQLRDNATNNPIGSAIAGTGATINLPTGNLATTTTFNVLATGGAACAAVQLTGTVTITVSGSINTALTIAPQAPAVCSSGSAGNFGFMLKLQNENFFRNMNFCSSDYPTPARRLKLDITYTQPGPIVNSITLQPDGATGKDALIQSYPSLINTNDGTSPEFAGTAWTKSGVPGVVRGVVEFDFSSIPGNAIITSAKLSLFANDAASGLGQHSTLSGSNAAWLERITSNWVESTVTWNTQPSTTTQNRVSLPASVSPSQDYLNIDVTALVLDMMSSPSGSTSIDISSSEVGVNYQLRDNSNNSTIGSPVAGTGGTISLPTGNLLATTTFNIIASNGTCSIQMTTTPTVTVNNSPNISLSTSASINPVCTGGSSSITVANSEVGVSYQLRDASNANVGSAVVGTGGTINLPTAALAATATFNVLASSGVCAPVQLTNTVTVNVGGSLNTGLTVTAQSSPICSGTATNIQIANSENGVTYQLRDDSNDALVGTTVSGTGATINLPTGNLAASTTFNVLASNGACSIEMTTLVTVTVNTQPNAGLGVSAQNAAVCSATSTNIRISNSEVGVSYQLRDNSNNSLVGSAVAGTGATINLPTGNLVASTTFNVLASGGGSCSVQLASTVSVNVLLPSDPLCSGGGGINCGAFTISATDTRPTCSGQDDGTITISVSGGTPNYVVTLSDPSQGFSQAMAGPGPFIFGAGPSGGLSPSLTYQYTILDGTGNTCTLPYSLPIQTNLQATAAGFVDAKCFNQAVGQATVTVSSGGTSPYEYSLDAGTTWVSFTSPVTITNLMPAATPYSILVRDDASDLCPAQVSVTINNAVTDITTSFTNTDASCSNNDGSIQVGPVSGGTAPYTYRLDSVDYAALPANNTFTGLAGGTHKFTVIDAIGCSKYFKTTINFPGLVNFTAIFNNPDCSGNGNNGNIIVTITSSGTFDVGITTDPVNDPTVFQTVVSAGATQVTFNGLSQGSYYVVAKPAGALCPSRSSPIAIGGGPVAVDFTIIPEDFICFETKGTARIAGIKGSSLVDYSYQIILAGTIIQSGTITQLQALPPDTINYTGLDKGNYQMILFQDQSAASGCASPISSSYKSFSINGPAASLDTLYVNRTLSLPSIASGSMLIGIQESQAEPYQLMLHLVNPHLPGQKNNYAFDSTWVHVSRNNQNLIMEFNAANIYGGDYRLSIRDTLGCTRTYDLSLDFDKEIYVPNVFTPNNDGKNDTFQILNLPDGSKLVITNRWGKEVYQSSNYQNNWNGGAEVDGIYYYNLTAGGKTYTGWVEIMHPSY